MNWIKKLLKPKGRRIYLSRGGICEYIFMSGRESVIGDKKYWILKSPAGMIEVQLHEGGRCTGNSSYKFWAYTKKELETISQVIIEQQFIKLDEFELEHERFMKMIKEYKQRG